MSMEKNKKKKKNKGHVRNKECIGVKLKSQLKIKKIIRRILDLPTSYLLATLHNRWVCSYTLHYQPRRWRIIVNAFVT